MLSHTERRGGARGGIEAPTLRFSVLVSGAAGSPRKFQRILDFNSLRRIHGRPLRQSVPEHSANFHARLHRICTGGRDRTLTIAYGAASPSLRRARRIPIPWAKRLAHAFRAGRDPVGPITLRWPKHRRTICDAARTRPRLTTVSKEFFFPSTEPLGDLVSDRRRASWSRINFFRNFSRSRKTQT